MMKTHDLFRFVVLAILCSSSGLVVAQDASPSTASQKEYVRMPWHLVDLWWDFGEDTPFQSFSFDITISDPVPPETRLYLAPIGLGHLSGTAFYGGIQTQLDGNTRSDKQLRKLGPGFLMSMWGERSVDAIRPSMGGYLQSSGHEGDFISVRRPYVWDQGVYTYRLTRMDEEQIDGKPHTWVGAFVYSHQKDEHVFLGALRFPGKDLILDRKIANFVEIYGQRRPVSEIPKLTVTFGNPVLNGKPVDPKAIDAVYPQGVPDFAEAKLRDGAVVVTVGTPVEGRTERNPKLLSR